MPNDQEIAHRGPRNSDQGPRPERHMTFTTEPCQVCGKPDQNVETWDHGERKRLKCDHCRGPFAITRRTLRRAHHEGRNPELSNWIQAKTERGEDIGEINIERYQEIFDDAQPLGSKHGLRITTVSIRNFRCIQELSVELDDTTVLIGENNSGKTAFLEAIRICLEQLHGGLRGTFQAYDYHLRDESSTPANAGAIEIELSFAEPAVDTWHDELAQELAEVILVRDDGRREIRFRLTSRFEQATEESSVQWAFLDDHANPLPGQADPTGLLMSLQRLAPVFYLSALRDASRHFETSGRYWRTFLTESSIPQDDRRSLEKDFSALNRRLLDVHKPLAEVYSKLADANKVIDFGAADAVAIDALPTKLFSLLSRTEVSLASRAGAKIPVERQGEGTQSLAVLLLFNAFLHSRLSNFDPIAEPITALEEPEAHLHPSAARALMTLLHDLPGQRIVSTHSGDLLANVGALSVRRFAHRDGRIHAHRIDSDTLQSEQMRKFDFHVRRSRGELLFARCWLLVEGETEAVIFSGAAEALELELERAGVRCVEYSQTDVGMLARVANQLGILWYCVVDDDSGRGKYENKVKQQLQAAAEADRMVFPYENVERFLCDNGFGDLYESRMSNQKPPPAAPPGTPEYWSQVLGALPNGYSKPAVAVDAAIKMKTGEKSVPGVLQSILEKVISLAGE